MRTYGSRTSNRPRVEGQEHKAYIKFRIGTANWGNNKQICHQRCNTSSTERAAELLAHFEVVLLELKEATSSSYQSQAPLLPRSSISRTINILICGRILGCASENKRHRLYRDPGRGRESNRNRAILELITDDQSIPFS